MVRSRSSVRFPSPIIFLAAIASVTKGQEPEKAAPEPVRSAIIVAGQSDGGGVFQVEAFGLDAPMMVLPSLPVGQMAISFAGPGAGGAWADSVNWLNDEDLLNELGIVEEQRAELDRIREEVVQRRRDFFDFFRTVKPEKRGEFVKEFGELLVANVDKQVEQVLLPVTRGNGCACVRTRFLCSAEHQSCVRRLEPGERLLHH